MGERRSWVGLGWAELGPDGQCKWASERAGSRKSFVHSDPYRKLKTEPIQVVLLFGPLRRILFFQLPQVPLSPPVLLPLWKSSHRERQIQWAEKKEQKALSVDMCQEYNTQLAGAKHAFLRDSKAKNRKA